MKAISVSRIRLPPFHPPTIGKGDLQGQHEGQIVRTKKEEDIDQGCPPISVNVNLL